MPQPRKEQVKNLKTKYVRGPQSVTFAGGPVQQLTGTNYSNVLAATRTGVDGGAESASPAVLTGGQGPYTMAFNSSFTIIMPGVNAGLPITVTFLQADFVKLNAGDVMTTSRTAAKINSVLGGYGITVAVASNVNGRLVLRSANSSGYTFGDDAFISLSDVTPGILQILGFGLSNQASTAGISAPRRGLVTVSRDGFGGTVQIRNLDTTPAEPQNTAMLHVAPYRYTPEILPGRPAYARVRKIPPSIGTGLEVAYFRTGPIRPSIVTSAPGSAAQSNFGGLTLGTVIKITVEYGNGTTVSFDVSTEDVVTVQQVVDAVNAAYQAATLALPNGTEFNRAAVPTALPGPYVFSDPATRDSFFVSFNGNAPIHINPPAGEYSAQSFADYVNAQIGGASQVAEGEAVAVSLSASEPPRTVFRSKIFSGESSSVAFLPGNPGGTAPGGFMGTLDALGIVPGLYKGTTCASLYGLDEIEFSCPSTLPGASITIEPQPPLNPGPAAALWGLPSPLAQSEVTVGPVRVTAPTVEVLLPEMVEFHEEPDDYDTEVQDFDNKGDAATIDPAFGVGNIGISALLGLTGKLDPSLIPTLLDTLNLNQLTLGSNRIKSATDQRAPRAVYPYDPAKGAVLLWEGVDVTEPSVSGLVRMYLNDGDVYITKNAKLNVSGSWDRDVGTVDSTMFEFRSGKGAFAKRSGGDPAPWTHADWGRAVTFNPTGSSDGIYRDGLVSLGAGLESGASALVPRIDAVTAVSTPALLFAAKASTGIVIRAYVTNTSAGNTAMLEITVNAKFNGSQWEKDVTGQQATRFDFTASGGLQLSTKNAANNTAWVGWDAFPVRLDMAGQINYFQYTLKLGFGATNASSPRLSADRYDPSTTRRTLLFESPVGSLASIPLRIYLDSSNTPWTGSVSAPSDGFMFTYNARWDSTLDKWVQDVPVYRSYAYAMLPDRVLIASKNLGAAPWSDGLSNWDRYSFMNLPGNGAEEFSGFTVKDGVFRVDNPGAISNPVFNNPIQLNTIYAKSMIKSWARNRYLVPNPAILDGFNVSTIQNWTIWDWYVYNATPLGYGSYTAVGSVEFNGSQSASNPVSQIIWGTSYNDRISVYFFNANGSWIDTSTGAGTIGMHIVLKATT